MSTSNFTSQAQGDQRAPTASVKGTPPKPVPSSDDATETEKPPMNGFESSSVPAWFNKTCKQTLPVVDKIIAEQGLKKMMAHPLHKAVFISQEHLWTDTPQIITCWFMDGTPKQHEKVAAVITEWTWYANIKFEKAPSANESIARIKFDPKNGNWSYVGRNNRNIAKDKETMNLASVNQKSELSDVERRVILHEFGHLLGLEHEHQSPAHGGSGIVNIEAALQLYKTSNGWDEKTIYEHVIRALSIDETSNFSQVDITSIMHYPMPKELTGLAQDIPYNTKLSDLDKAYMILQYPRKKLHSNAVKEGWSFEKALSVMGVPNDIKDNVLQQLKLDTDPASGEISPINTRGIITKWCRSAHAKVEAPPASESLDTEPKHPDVPSINANGVEDPPSGKPASRLIDVLQAALADSDISKWLASQPEGAKDKLWVELSKAFWKVST